MSEINYDILTKPFPKQAIKQRRGNGGVSLSYLETHSVIRRLIEATGNDFNFHVIAISQTPDLVMARVALEIGNSRKEHVGTARVAGNPDDAVKAAISDAIKKCATLWGVGLELYGPDYEAEQPQAAAPARPAAASPTQARPVQTQPQTRTASGAPVNRAVAMAGSRGSYRPN